jgi:ubiquinone biosynthesis monooxygenase Coq7
MTKAKKKQIKSYMPGDLPPETQVKQMIRVNHAGEYGARRIYQGQLAVLKGTKCENTIRHMAEQEEAHLAYFEEEVVKRQVRPTALQPVWHVLGFALGAGTALLGEKAAMACTVAVEETIDEHYQEQLEALDEGESALKAKIERFRAEELEHRDIGIEHDAEQTPGYEVLSGAIKAGSKLAIWLSKRV